MVRVKKIEIYITFTTLLAVHWFVFKVLNCFIHFVTYKIHGIQFLTEYSINMITSITCISSRNTSMITTSQVRDLILPSILDANMLFRINQDQYPAFQLSKKKLNSHLVSVQPKSVFLSILYFPHLI